LNTQWQYPPNITIKHNFRYLSQKNSKDQYVCNTSHNFQVTHPLIASNHSCLNEFEFCKSLVYFYTNTIPISLLAHENCITSSLLNQQPSTSWHFLLMLLTGNVLELVNFIPTKVRNHKEVTGITSTAYSTGTIRQRNALCGPQLPNRPWHSSFWSWNLTNGKLPGTECAQTEKTTIKK